ncbi:uncharacterized protein UMAG_10585 [Mycosarcoma maydis]|uniref:Uncharacterized protein n=1 Tax=Mycosarcoma maydis TaxID=5270 RepID=A0A0D1E370_MYCMD|nr:uncharacterized protein UMAG_10585 [Ustilago maydis 521]KIS70266.1 hypothetical protein UMAG_10585 [Ustilago maydis 521]|eukprot:XP_011388362.1 hypothetical protein UMAG_10585 [Ustilago maydis 521]
MKGEHLVRTLEHFHSFGYISAASTTCVSGQRPDADKISHVGPSTVLPCTKDSFAPVQQPGFFSTRRLDKIRHHMSVHGRKPKEHSDAAPLWRACQLQTYFTAKGIIDYFEVDDAVPIHPQQTARLDPSCTISTLASTSASTSTPTTTSTSNGN